MLPPLAGLPIHVEIRASLGAHLAASSIPERFILLDAEVLARSGEFERILVHELFHFAWVRFSNGMRRDWEALLQREILAGVQGELGWSAEWRKEKLTAGEPTRRTPPWRRYACESFCDTSAWLFAGLADHDEFTLPKRARRARRAWIESQIRSRGFLLL